MSHCFSFSCKSCSSLGNFWQTAGEERSPQIISSMKIKVLSMRDKGGLWIEGLFMHSHKYQISLICFSRAKQIHIRTNPYTH